MLEAWFAGHAHQQESEAWRRAYVAAARSRAKSSERLRAVEDELARVRLLAFALAQVCVDTGLVTPDELKEQLRKMDLSDGVEDGKLARGRPLPGSPPEPPPAPMPPVVVDKRRGTYLQSGRRRRFRPRD